MPTKCWSEYLKDSAHFEGTGKQWESNTKMDLKEIDGKLWNGFIWLRIRTRCSLFYNHSCEPPNSIKLCEFIE
jgi:hypothetical protein